MGPRYATKCHHFRVGLLVYFKAGNTIGLQLVCFVCETIENDQRKKKHMIGDANVFSQLITATTLLFPNSFLAGNMILKVH